MRSKSILLLAVSGACALAACSSSRPAESGNGAPAKTAPSARSSSTVVQSTGDAAAGPPASADGGNAFCTEMASAGGKLVSVVGNDPTKVDPATYQRELDQLIAAAPSAVRGDLRAIGAVELPVVKTGDLSGEAKLQEPAMLQHVQHFASWMQANCPGVLDNPTALPTG